MNIADAGVLGIGNGNIDPFIKVRIGEYNCKTKYKDDTANPEFNECL